MKHRRSSGLLAVMLVLGFLLAACGDDDYAKAKACEVDSSAIADVVGTSAFTVDSNETPLPLVASRTSTTNAYVCRIDVEGDRMFSIVIEFESASTNDERRQSITKSKHSFEHADGVGRVSPADVDKGSGSVYGMWVCGDVGVMIEGSATKAPRTENTIELTRQVADVAGCESISAPS